MTEEEPKVVNPSPASRQSQRKMLLVGLVGVAIVALALVIVLVRRKPASQKPIARNTVKNHSAATTRGGASNQQEAKVSITNSGFSPQTIEVKAGTIVTWTNNDTSPHQVAADPYPANNSISGFNNDMVLQQSQSYSFTFKDTGTFHVHDQLNPLKLTATIVVK